MVVDDQERFPIKKEGVVVGPGNQMKIQIFKTKKRTMPDPYSDCIELDKIDTVLSREMKRLGMTYNRRNCVLLCQQMMTIQQMGCYDLYLPRAFDAQPCLKDEQNDQIKYLSLNLSKCCSFFLAWCKLEFSLKRVINK